MNNFDIVKNKIQCFSPIKIEFDKFIEIYKSVIGTQSEVDMSYYLDDKIINTRPIHLLALKYSDKSIFKCIYTEYYDKMMVLIYFDPIFWKNYMDYNVLQWENAGRPFVSDSLTPLEYLKLKK